MNVKGCQKRETKKGRKVLGFNCVRRIQRKEERGKEGYEGQQR